MVAPEETAAMQWFRALQKELRDVQKNLEYCIRGQLAGNLDQSDLDDFVKKVNRLGHDLVKNTSAQNAD